MKFDQTNNDSSESDEDNNTRHDRFKSERFQKETSSSARIREERSTKHNDTNSHRYRDRSPRCHRSRHRETTSSSSSYRYVSRSDQDRSKKTHSKSRSDKHCEKEESKAKPKKSLSSMLKSFDKQVEEKRIASESCSQPSQGIGPALPPHLKQKEEEENEDNKERFAIKESPISDDFSHNLNKDSTLSTKESANIISEHGSGSCKVEIPLDMESESIITSEEQSCSSEGPVLPSHLHSSSKSDNNNGCKDKLDTTSSISSSPNVDTSTISLSNPDKLNLLTKPPPDSYGPALPPKVESSSYGPALPPKIEHDSYGPALPPELKNMLPNQSQVEASEEGIEEEESDDENLVGPLPDGKMNLTQYQLELRAESIKRQMEEEKSGSSKEIKKREEWMLELPPEKASNLGLGPRSFRKREAPDMSNRSDWTDTPADKLRKAEQAERGEMKPVNTEEVMRSTLVKERNEAMEKISKESQEEDRPKSLLELHQKKLQKKKKKEVKEGKKKERRPFDRNIDLQVNRFDDAQKKAIFKKAQLLDTRFSSGESKFL